MGKDIGYHCDDCQHAFPVRGYIVRDALKTHRSLACPSCGKTNTRRADTIKQRPTPQTPVDYPPSEAQLNYIISLGGHTNGIKTRHDAGEYITRLKKLKAGC